MKALPGVRSAALVDLNWRCVVELVGDAGGRAVTDEHGSRGSYVGARGGMMNAKEIVVTASSTFHIARPLVSRPDLVIHVALSREHGLLTDTRMTMATLQELLDLQAAHGGAV